MARLIDSPRGREVGPPPEPLIVYGHLASTRIGDLIAASSTLSCVAVEDLDDLDAWLGAHESAGILAQSRMSSPGEAAQAIAAFRRRHPRGRAALYQAWDYHVGRGAARALECGADAVMMPAIDANEMFALLFTVLARAGQGAAPPATVEEHEALLRELAPASPFWGLQERVESIFY